jgi:dTDP-4-amino-4,6-dideoxygalactose transaminase
MPENCEHNAHMYYIILSAEIDRKYVLDEFHRNNIMSVFHYVPLHSSPAGKRYGKIHGEMVNTDSLSSRIIRLPLWVGLSEDQQKNVVNVLCEALVFQ